MLDITFRSASKAAWEDAALAWGILKPNPSTDPDAPPYIVAPGFHVDHLGFVVLDPGTPGANPGDPPIVPPTLDTWWRTNVRLSDSAYADDIGELYPGDTHDGFKFRYSKLVGQIRNAGRPVKVANFKNMQATQHGVGKKAVQVLDPSDPVGPAPQRVWFGGMSY